MKQLSTTALLICCSNETLLPSFPSKDDQVIYCKTIWLLDWSLHPQIHDVTSFGAYMFYLYNYYFFSSVHTFCKSLELTLGFWEWSMGVSSGKNMKVGKTWKRHHTITQQCFPPIFFLPLPPFNLSHQLQSCCGKQEPKDSLLPSRKMARLIKVKIPVSYPNNYCFIPPPHFCWI